MATQRICSIEGCGKPLGSGGSGYGYCSRHYYLYKVNGSPLVNRRKHRFDYMNTVVATHTDATECLIWPFTRHYANGYGMIKTGGKPRTVSRLVCEIVNGPPPTPEHQAAHSCGKGHEGCVNPKHLRWATALENIHDKYLHGTLKRQVS